MACVELAPVVSIPGVIAAQAIKTMSAGQWLAENAG